MEMNCPYLVSRDLWLGFLQAPVSWWHAREPLHTKVFRLAPVLCGLFPFVSFGLLFDCASHLLSQIGFSLQNKPIR